MSDKTFCVYIMTNDNNNVLYTGVTGDLKARVYSHKEELIKGFTKRYNIKKLVYFECCNDPLNAIEREKQIKARSRKYKIELINSMNPAWNDLYNAL